MNTNEASQWSLNTIISLELIPDSLPDLVDSARQEANVMRSVIARRPCAVNQTWEERSVNTMTTDQPTETGVLHTAKSPLIPESWRAIYANPLAKPEHVADFRMEGEGAITFPLGRMRLESVRDEAEARAISYCGARRTFRRTPPSHGILAGPRAGPGDYVFSASVRKAGICSILPSSHVLANTTSIITAK